MWKVSAGDPQELFHVWGDNTGLDGPSGLTQFKAASSTNNIAEGEKNHVGRPQEPVFDFELPAFHEFYFGILTESFSSVKHEINAHWLFSLKICFFLSVRFNILCYFGNFC